MPRVQISSYSKFYHGETGVQFQPVLDRRSGCYVGVADVDKATAKKLISSTAFQMLTDDEFDQMTKMPEPPEPEPSNTGDPLTDHAGTGGATEPIDLNGPPAPESK